MKLGKSRREKDSARVVSVAVIRDGKLLFGLRGDTGKWNLPGGHVEPGESPRAAAERELKEEAGLTGTLWEELGWCDVRDGLRVYSFVCRSEAGEADAGEDPDEEMVAFAWAPGKTPPKKIMGNLHNAKDVTLQFLGMQDRDLDLIWDDESPRQDELDGYLVKAEQLELIKSLDRKSDPHFQQWFQGSQTVHPETGQPLVFYRGTRRPSIDGRLNTQSFASSPDVGSVYAATPSSSWSNPDPSYLRGSTVHPVHIKMTNPLDLRRYGHQMTFGDYLTAMRYGQEGGMQHDEAIKVLNYLSKRYQRTVGMDGRGDFAFKVRRHEDDYDPEVHDSEDLDDEWGSNQIQQLRDDMEYERDPEKFIRQGHRLQADSYAFADSPRTKAVGQRLGHDGVIHHDVFQGANVAGPALLGKDPEEMHGVSMEGDDIDNENYDQLPTHETWRPFSPAEQIRPIYHNFSPGMKMPAPVFENTSAFPKVEPEQELDKAAKSWRSKDGISIPVANTPERKDWDQRYHQSLVQAFGRGDAKALRPLTIDPNDPAISGTNMPVNKQRLNLYRRMAAAGDSLPPVIVRRNGSIGYSLVDGNHRQEAAKQAGLKTLNAYEIVPLKGPPVRKSEEEHIDMLAKMAGLDDVMARTREIHAHIAKLAGMGEYSHVFRHPQGGHVMVSKDPSKPGRWRATRIDADGTPTSHTEAADVYGALKHAHSYGADMMSGVMKSENFVKAESLEKMALIHSGPDHKIIYRVENSRGEGPYTGPTHPGHPDTPDAQVSSRPYPREDFAPDELGSNDRLYGFESPEHAAQWFGAHGLRSLARIGYNLTAVPAKKVWRSGSGSQALFEPHESYRPGTHPVVEPPAPPPDQDCSKVGHGWNVDYVCRRCGEDGTETDPPGADAHFAQLEAKQKQQFGKAEDLEKSVLGAVAGAALSLGHGTMPTPPQPHVQQVQQAPEVKWTPEGLHPDLNSIAQLESNFGQNTHHAAHSKGEYHTAVGAVGFKPITAHEEWRKTKTLQQAYPGLEDPAQFVAKLKADPKLYNLTASAHWLRLKARFGSAARAAYAWRWGWGSAAKAPDQQVEADPYVQKYRSLTAGHTPIAQKSEWETGLGAWLAKATKDEDFRSIARAVTGEGRRLVDHTAQMSEHPAEQNPVVEHYKQNVLEGPIVHRKAKGSTRDSGITSKVMLKTAVQPQQDLLRPTSGMNATFMIKPYHEKVIRRTGSWQKYPIQGWAEMANQALYHAGGIGHLHQKVHVAEHNMGPGFEKEPALVVNLEKGMKPAFKMGYNEESKAALALSHDAMKVGLMDFLTNNLDRHGGNLMYEMHAPVPKPYESKMTPEQLNELESQLKGIEPERPPSIYQDLGVPDPGQEFLPPKMKRLLAIDHSRSFQYVNTHDHKWDSQAKAKRIREFSDSMRPYLFGSNTTLSPVAQFLPKPRGYDGAHDFLENHAKPLFDWWEQASPKIRATMAHQLEHIKDPEVKAHIKRNFEERLRWLDERAEMGIENYGTSWYDDPVTQYHPDQKSDEEHEQERKREAVAQYEREEAARRAGES